MDIAISRHEQLHFVYGNRRELQTNRRYRKVDSPKNRFCIANFLADSSPRSVPRLTCIDICALRVWIEARICIALSTASLKKSLILTHSCQALVRASITFAVFDSNDIAVLIDGNGGPATVTRR
jgi:hypothetical protein